MSEVSVAAKLGAKGQYQVEIPGKSCSGWFDNLLLNQGLDNMTTTGLAFWYCQVGTGSTEPAVGQTALAALAAGAVSASSGTATIDTVNRQWICTWTYTFPEGTFNSINLTEIGTGTATTGTTLSSRALIRDEVGNPVALTVLLEDALVVRYRLIINQPTGDFVGNGATIRAAFVNNLTGSTSNLNGWLNSFQPFQTVNSPAQFRIGGTIGAITAGPSGGSSANAASGQNGNGAYTPGSFSREFFYRLTATQLNGGTGVNTMLYVIGPTLWQLQLDTPIIKTDPQTLRLNVSLSWGRA